jgi:hypothetical protein
MLHGARTNMQNAAHALGMHNTRAEHARTEEEHTKKISERGVPIVVVCFAEGQRVVNCGIDSYVPPARIKRIRQATW